MSRTRRKKFPRLDDDNEFNIEVSRGLHSEKLPHRDPDIDYFEVDGLRGKKEAKHRMAKQHRQKRRIDLKEKIRDWQSFRDLDEDFNV
jgi:hypothetical protein